MFSYSVSCYAEYLSRGVAGLGTGRYFPAIMCVVRPLAYIMSGYVGYLLGGVARVVRESLLPRSSVPVTFGVMLVISKCVWRVIFFVFSIVYFGLLFSFSRNVCFSFSSLVLSLFAYDPPLLQPCAC